MQRIESNDDIAPCLSVVMPAYNETGTSESTAVITSSKWARWPVVILLAAIFLLYFSFLPVSYSFDGTVFSQMLRYALHRHDWLGVAQIHHLLYFPLTYWLYRALETLFHYRVLEFFHLQLFSMLFGIATLLLIERMLKRLGLDPWLRLAGVSIVAFSHAFWLFSVDAEVHIPGLFFMVAGMYWLIFGKAKTRSLVGAALCFAVAAGFHLTNGLAALAVLIFLLAQHASWRRVGLFCTTYAVLLPLMFGGYFLLSHKSFTGVLQSVLAGTDLYSGYHIAYYKPFSWSTFIASLTSVKTALVTGNNWASWVVFLVFVALVTLGYRSLHDKAKTSARRMFLLWASLYFLFFTWWDPDAIEFKIHVTIPLLLIAITILSRIKPFVSHAVGILLAGSLLGINLTYSIKPQSTTTKNIDYQTAMAIRHATPENAQMLITGKFTDHSYGYGKIYIPYFAGREVLVLDWLLGKGYWLPAILAELSRRTGSGRPIYTLDEIAVPGKALTDLLNFHQLSEENRALLTSAIRFVPVTPLPGGRRLYRMEFISP